MSRKDELYIQTILAQRIATHYPDVIFRSDLGGIKLTMGQAVQAKRLQGGGKAYPDMFIAEPRNGYYGCYGEVKKDAGEVYTKKGEMRQDAHIREQAEMLERLRAKGYKADFWLGLDHAWGMIQAYLEAR